MKTTLELLNEVEEMGFKHEYVLEQIDLWLDTEFGYECRKALADEFLDDELYEDILSGFQCELDVKNER